MNELERIVDESSKEITTSSNSETPTPRLFYEKAKEATTNYLIDISAGMIFYNPVMATGEYLIAGMEKEEIVRSRIAATIAQALFMRPTGILRNASAQYFGLTKESPRYKTTLSDMGSILAIQIPAYSLALYNAGATFEQGTKALGFAVAVAVVSGRPFRKWMDTWRKIWGKNKRYDEQTSITNI